MSLSALGKTNINNLKKHHSLGNIDIPKKPVINVEQLQRLNEQRLQRQRIQGLLQINPKDEKIQDLQKMLDFQKQMYEEKINNVKQNFNSKVKEYNNLHDQQKTKYVQSVNNIKIEKDDNKVIEVNKNKELENIEIVDDKNNKDNDEIEEDEEVINEYIENEKKLRELLKKLIDSKRIFDLNLKKLIHFIMD
jgi:hypothetical protein